jgi:glutathione S-transferase
MKLVGSLTSPYVRKVRVLLAEKQLAHDFLEESAWTAQTTVPRYNPLNKVPALVLDDGASIYDSAVITEYLDALPGRRLLPAGGAERAVARCHEALGDGIMDAGITIFLERKREPSRQDPGWIQRQASKVDAGMAALAEALGKKPFLGGTEMALGDIACGCALFWLDFRLKADFDWRARHAALAAWAQRLEARASFAQTRPPAGA